MNWAFEIVGLTGISICICERNDGNGIVNSNQQVKRLDIFPVYLNINVVAIYLLTTVDTQLFANHHH